MNSLSEILASIPRENHEALLLLLLATGRDISGLIENPTKNCSKGTNSHRGPISGQIGPTELRRRNQFVRIR